MSSVAIAQLQPSSATGHSCSATCLGHEVQSTDDIESPKTFCTASNVAESSSTSFFFGKRRRSNQSLNFSEDIDNDLVENNFSYPRSKRLRAVSTHHQSESNRSSDQCSGSSRNNDSVRNDQTQTSRNLPQLPLRNYEFNDTSGVPLVDNLNLMQGGNPNFLSVSNGGHSGINTNAAFSCEDNCFANEFQDPLKQLDATFFGCEPKDQDFSQKLISFWTEQLFSRLRDSSSIEDAEERTRKLLNDFLSYLIESRRSHSHETNLLDTLALNAQKRLEQLVAEKQLLTKGVRTLYEKLQEYQTLEATSNKEIADLKAELFCVKNNYQKLKDSVQIYMYNMNVDPHHLKFHERLPPDVY